MPVFIASNPEWAKKFEEKNIPIIGDDIKAQLGATITHRILADLFEKRGKARREHTSSIPEETRISLICSIGIDLLPKGNQKTEAVQSVLSRKLDDDNIHIGPSDYVEAQKDNKVCFENGRKAFWGCAYEPRTPAFRGGLS